MAITAKEVNELRKKTGAGMMDCKKALTEANGDMEAAVDILRKKGQKIAAKREDRDASEGCVLAKTNDAKTVGVVLALNCETDFVAKNEDFINLTNEIIDVAIANDITDHAALMAATLSNGLTISDKLTEQIGVIGEKIEITQFANLKSEGVAAYIHPGNKLATIVAVNKNSDAVLEAARQVAMQVAAMNPLALNKDGIDEETIARELEVGKELAIQEGKPAEMAENIAKGRLNKFFKENTLLSQPFIKDNKSSVADFLKTIEGDLVATAFKRASL